MKSKTISRMYDIAKLHVKSIVIISILSLIVSVFEILRPYLIKIAIDDYLVLGVYQKGFITIGLIAGVYIFFVVIENVLNYVTMSATNMMGENIVYTIRNKLYRYMQYANISFHDKTPAGKLFVRITSDVEDIATFFKEVATTIFKDIIIIIALITIMIVVNVKLSLILFVIMPLFAIFSYTIARTTNKLYEYSKTVKTKLNIFLAESIYGAKLIKVFNRHYEKQKECEDLTDKFFKSRLLPSFLEALLPNIMFCLENLGIALMIWATVNKWMGIDIGVGVVYVFVTYMKQLFEPLNRIIENVETVGEAVVSVNKVYDILDKTEYLENLEEGIVLDKIKGKIEFKNVWFAYNDEDWVLKGVSFLINPGESIAFVGKTGSRQDYNNKFNKQIL